MYTFEIKTLVDITNTQVIRPNQGSQLEYDQNRNFITLRQCVELRSIVNYDYRPHVETVDLSETEFGKNYKGKHRVWTFMFTPDRDGVYTDSKGNILGWLIEDLNNVPIIKNLTETVNIDVAVFDCNDSATCNTIIKAYPGTI
jgi:hypothetical protein